MDELTSATSVKAIQRVSKFKCKSHHPGHAPLLGTTFSFVVSTDPDL